MSGKFPWVKAIGVGASVAVGAAVIMTGFGDKAPAVVEVSQDADVEGLEQKVVPSDVPGLNYRIGADGRREIVLNEDTFGDFLEGLQSQEARNALVLKVVEAGITDNQTYLRTAFSHYVRGGDDDSARKILERINGPGLVRTSYRKWAQDCVDTHSAIAADLSCVEEDGCLLAVCASYAEAAGDKEHAEQLYGEALQHANACDFDEQRAAIYRRLGNPGKSIEVYAELVLEAEKRADFVEAARLSRLAGNVSNVGFYRGLADFAHGVSAPCDPCDELRSLGVDEVTVFTIKSE